MKVSFILLAHEPAEKLKSLLGALLGAGSNVFVHHDASTPGNLAEAVASWGYDQLPGKIYFADRVKVVWGEWSIVQATLNCIDKIHQHDEDSDYFMLLSGSCMPVKPVKMLEEHLAQSGKDHIEAVNAEKYSWITAGIQKERWSHYHFFNWRYQQRRFDYSLKLQGKLKVDRKIPLGHNPHMGSQWWCLRRSTVFSIHDLVARQPVLRRFYKRTWVPDELFFQTMVANLVPQNEIVDELITRYRFNEWGIPRVYYDDDIVELLAEDKFFVRKVSHSAPRLRARLQQLAVMESDEFATHLEQDCQGELQALRSHLNLVEHIRGNHWFNLASHQENKFDYIKSIPNRFIVLVGGDRETKRMALTTLDSMQDTVVYGDLFDPKEVGAGYENTGFLGVSKDSVRLALHTWHQVLGDIAYHAPGKTIVFSLGRNAKEFLDVLRWSPRVNILMIDGKYTDYHSRMVMEDLYLKSQTYYKLQQRNCHLSRISNVNLNELVEHCMKNSHSWRYFLGELKSNQARQKWPSLLRRDHDHYAFLKALRSRMIVLITENEMDRRKVVGLIQDNHAINVFSNVFGVIPRGDRTLDWHYYLSDLAYLNARATGEHVFAMHLPTDDIPRLETLRWKKGLLVIHVEGKDATSDSVVLKPKGAMDQLKFQDRVQAERDLLATYMQERQCDFLSFRNDEMDCLSIDFHNWLAAHAYQPEKP